MGRGASALEGLEVMDNPLSSDLDHVLAHTEGLWEELRGQRIFMTGGTGFFGCWLLESFAWANDKLGLDASVLVLTRDPDAFRRKAPHLATRPDIEFLVGDVRTFRFPEGRFSHVIHAAIPETKRALELARRSGVKKFLLTSSGAVYEKPLSTYGAEKLKAEQLCSLYAQQCSIETKIARCFAFVGPYLPLDANFAVGNFIGDAMSGRPIQVKEDGTPYRSYLYAADLAIWLWTILFRGETGCPYNVGSAGPLTIAELAEMVAHISYPRVPVAIAKTPPAGQPAKCYIPDVRQTETALNLHEWVSLAEGIRRTIRWHATKGEGNV